MNAVALVACVFYFFSMSSLKQILLFVLLFSAVSFAVPVSYGTAYTDTVFVTRVSSEKSYIAVRHGCRTDWIKQDSVLDKNLPQDSLLSLVYGNVPSPDSADIYRGWSQSCQQYSSKRFREGWQLIGVAAVFAALGVTLTFVVDYEHLGTAILGRTFGIASLLTLVPVSFTWGTSSISGSSKQKEQGERYMEKAERYKLSVTPAINLREPGGGLLLQLGF